jgi:hypothetical protein
MVVSVVVLRSLPEVGGSGGGDGRHGAEALDDGWEDLEEAIDLGGPTLTRREPWARSWGRPRARRTWEASREPEVQADPEEAAMPSKSRLRSMDSPSM